jgi:hypothetical protein
MSRQPAFRLAGAASCLVWLAAGIAGELVYGEDASKVGSADPSPSQVASSVNQAAAPQQKTSQQVCRTFRVRDQDQVWLISTRHLGCCMGGKNWPTYQIWLYEKGTWQPRTEAEFFAADSAEIVTPMYVHGNRLTAGEASSYGLSFYFEFVGKFDHEPPVRFVIWSWPSDEIKGQLKDVRAKADRSDYEAYYLACFLARMKPEVHVGLLGYSFGARIVSGALHLLNGGAICGQMVSAGDHPQFRVALWAAAEHNYWYQPGQFHGRAPAAADAWFITINCCDPVLARYRFLDKCSDADAVGYSGIYGRNLLPPDVNSRIEERNVTNIVGGTHDWRAYLYSQWIQDHTRDYILWHPLFGSGAEKQASAAMVGAAAE